MIAIDETGWFFVNEHLIARLGLSHNLAYGDVNAMVGFSGDHTGEPDFQNFNVSMYGRWISPPQMRYNAGTMNALKALRLLILIPLLTASGTGDPPAPTVAPDLGRRRRPEFAGPIWQCRQLSSSLIRCRPIIRNNRRG